MQLNGASNLMVSNQGYASRALPEIKKQDSLGTEQSATYYDVHNMSPDELGKLAQELHESGQISLRDRMMIDLEVYIMTDLGRGSKDTKIDMINRFDKMLSYEKTQPEPNAQNIISLERTLDILHAVESRSNITFPISV